MKKSVSIFFPDGPARPECAILDTQRTSQEAAAWKIRLKIPHICGGSSSRAGTDSPPLAARRGRTCCASCCLPRLQVLRETGVIKARKEATRVFYYLALQDSGIENVARLFADILQILRNALDKSGED